MITIRHAHERGHANHGWLDTYHTFSFGDYYDAQHTQFRSLRVMNEDTVQPGQGFGTHPHRDMEIVTYVLEGALQHKDSMGNGEVLRPGEFQRMSAGTGITHSEFNHSTSEGVHFLQIWMGADRKGVTPRYNQKTFSDQQKRGKLCPLLVPEGETKDAAMPWYSDSRVYAGLFDGAERSELNLGPNRYAYVHVIRGKVKVNGTQLDDGDGARVRNEQTLVFSDGRDAEILVFDLRPREVPDVP